MQQLKRELVTVTIAIILVILLIAVLVAVAYLPGPVSESYGIEIKTNRPTSVYHVEMRPESINER